MITYLQFAILVALPLAGPVLILLLVLDLRRAGDLHRHQRQVPPYPNTPPESRP